MFAALFIPDFHLQAQLRLRPEWDGLPVALLECPAGVTGKEQGKARILQITREAASAGIVTGITATRAQARCPSLLLIHRNPEDEEASREALWNCAAEVTRDFEASGPGLVTLDLHGVRYAPEKLAAGRIDCLRSLGLSARAGLAANPDLAFLAARLADSVLTFQGPIERIRERLAPLPVTALQPSPDWLELFRLWGVQTIGDLTALPRNELVERLGPAVGRCWDQGNGCAQRLLRLVRAPQVYSESLDLDDPIDSTEPLLFLLRRFVERIVCRLAAAHLAAGSLELHLGLDGAPSHRRTFRIPEPTRDVEVLLRILQTHLDTFTAPAPVIAISLEAVPTRSNSGQTQLFQSSWKDPNRLADTLARVEALLGAERVGIPVPGLSHRSDTFRMEPFLTGTLMPQTVSETVIRSGPPLRRFRPRRPVSVVTTACPHFARPDAIVSGAFRGTLTDQRGPWLGSGDWWNEADWRREEWDVLHESGTCYRLVLESGKWFVEGGYD